MNPETLDTNSLLALMARLQFIKTQAHEQAFQSGSDPRYSAIEVKVTDLLARLKKLIAPVMLAEIEGLQKITKDWYQMLGEIEDDKTTKGHNDRGN